MVYGANSLTELENEVQKNVTTSLSYAKELKEYILSHNMTDSRIGLGTDLTAVEGLIDHVAPRLVTNADLNTFDLASLEAIVKRHMNRCMENGNDTGDFGFTGDC